MDLEQARPDRPGDGYAAAAGSGRGEWAYEMLHDAIREGGIEPGQRLMEVEVSTWLGMSRTPVREAMRRLHAEGMLEHGVGGMAVVQYDLRAIGEFYATRESLEGTAAALAAQNADATEIRILTATLDAMRALPADPRAHARENQAFHEVIYQAARNRFLLQSLRSLLKLVPLLGRTTYNAPGRIANAHTEHVEIVEAIRAHDTARAEQAIKRHVRHSHECRILVVSETLRETVRERSHRPVLRTLEKQPNKPRGPKPRPRAA